MRGKRKGKLYKKKKIKTEKKKEKRKKRRGEKKKEKERKKREKNRKRRENPQELLLQGVKVGEPLPKNLSEHLEFKKREF